MTTTMTTTTTTTTRPVPQRRGLDERRLAGIGALAFAAIVITTNALLGSTPSFDADADEVLRYVTENRTAGLLSAAAFAIGAPFLIAFATGFYGRLRAVGRAEDLVWARMGMVGALLILPTFAAVVTNRIVLLAGAEDLAATPELITLLWRLEMAAFMLNMLPLAVGIIGFGIAGTRAGFLPGWYRRIVPVAAGSAVLTAATAVSSLEGSAIGMAGFVAFASWMLLLVLAGRSQLRSA